VIRYTHLRHQFVKGVPRSLEAGVLYVSMEHGTAIHSCCCGCGQEVVTPITPTDWRISFDGETVSLSPSVGNWQLPCRSHYVIKHNRVIEAGPWTGRQVAQALERERVVKAKYYGAGTLRSAPVSTDISKPEQTPTLTSTVTLEPPIARSEQKSFLSWLRSFIG
jgi:hypothetical protein